MSGAPDNNRSPAKPYLITRDREGAFRLFLCETRYNSQNYPIVTSTKVEAVFESTNAARAYAKKEFGGKAGEFTFASSRTEPRESRQL
jgi:hypothetical protein